ncbi:hypothetical protein WG66_008532, partial [Moniliophthora roreri]
STVHRGRDTLDSDWNPLFLGGTTVLSRLTGVNEPHDDNFCLSFDPISALCMVCSQRT